LRNLGPINDGDSCIGTQRKIIFFSKALYRLVIFQDEGNCTALGADLRTDTDAADILERRFTPVRTLTDQ